MCFHDQLLRSPRYQVMQNERFTLSIRNPPLLNPINLKFSMSFMSAVHLKAMAEILCFAGHRRYKLANGLTWNFRQWFTNTETGRAREYFRLGPGMASPSSIMMPTLGSRFPGKNSWSRNTHRTLFQISWRFFTDRPFLFYSIC